MCNWRRSLKIAYHNKKIVETVNEKASKGPLAILNPYR